MLVAALNGHIAMQVSKFPLSFMFGMCSLFLGVAALCQRWLERLVTVDNARGEYQLVDNTAKGLVGTSAGADADKGLVAV